MEKENMVFSATSTLPNPPSEAAWTSRIEHASYPQSLLMRGYDSMLQKEADEPVKIAPESEMVRPKNPNRNIGVTDKETNNHDSHENSQRARNVDDESFRNNLHDKDHGYWLIVSYRKCQSEPKNERKSFGREGVMITPSALEEPLPTIMESPSLMGMLGISRVFTRKGHESEKVSCDVNDTRLVGEAGRSKLTAKNKVKGSNNIHRPGYIGAGMYSMMPVRMGPE
ncbi:unnamed protein product [Lupinus luteus]|uniref:Uncharacterized protein n=1 Tax=Lupinus luteus TaxID=3873 RepID=A0AAV1Y8X5_LUPLU